MTTISSSMSPATNSEETLSIEQPECPACGNCDFRFLFTKKERKFWRCQCCGLQRQWPLPTMEELASYYEQSYCDGMYLAFTEAEEMKLLTAQARYRQLADFCLPGRWLDVGCSNGILLEELEAQGIEAEGVELSQVAVDMAREKNLHVHCGTIDDIPLDQEFDTITAFDVLEHVLDPRSLVQGIEQRLKPGGVAAISVPNLNSLSRWLMGRRWYFYIPEEHLHYFSPNSLRRLLERAGLDILVCRRTYKPLTYDYSLVQFQEYNPVIYRVLSMASKVLPGRIRKIPVPLCIGEMLMVARKP